jgi:putative ABC transport system ATP-binding protein
MITAKELKKTYFISRTNHVHALNGVSFEIEEGSISAIIGPSGSGKSTILNILGGMDRDYEGELMVGDKDIKDYNQNYYRRYVVGTIFQQFYLVPSLNVEENILLPTVFSSRKTGDQNQDRLEYLLQRVGLLDRRKHKPRELSGGQAQRVAIARALMGDPAILLADEPTGNLDTKTGGEIVELMYELNREEHTTMIIVTHDTSLFRDVKTKIHLKDGEVTS